MSPYAGNLFCSSLVIKQLKTLKSGKKEAEMVGFGQQKGSKRAQPKVMLFKVLSCSMSRGCDNRAHYCRI